MSRPSKGIRLWLEPAEHSTDGKIIRHATWVIRDGSRKVRTGCIREDRGRAEQALADYITARYQAPRDRNRHPTQTLVLDVLNIYLADMAKNHARPEEENSGFSRSPNFGSLSHLRTLMERVA